MALQVLFSVMTVWMIMQVAQRCFGARAANLAGAFWALSLPLLWMPTIFWETSLSTLLLVSLIAWALRYERRPGLLSWALMGGYCGLALLVNPALLLPLLSILGWAAWQTRKTFRYSPLLGLSILFLVCSVADPECACAACLHPPAQHGRLRIMGGKPSWSNRLSG